MIRFSRVIFGSIGLLACALLLSVTASASPLGSFLRVEPELAITLPVDLAKTFILHVVDADQKVAISHREHDQEQWPEFSRSIGILAPEYAESFDTHGLNFVDLRRRC